MNRYLLLLHKGLCPSLLVVLGAVCLGMNGCFDYETPLPKGYRLIRTNADTVMIWSPIGILSPTERGSECVVPPKVIGLEVSGEVIYGVAASSPGADISSVPGFFVIDCKNGAVRVGLSEPEWKAVLHDLGIVPRPLRKPSKWFRWSGPRAP